MDYKTAQQQFTQAQAKHNTLKAQAKAHPTNKQIQRKAQQAKRDMQQSVTNFLFAGLRSTRSLRT